MPKNKGGRPSAYPWEEIGRLYATGQYSPADICRKYGMSPATFSEQAKKRGFFISEAATSIINRSVEVSESFRTIAETDPELARILSIEVAEKSALQLKVNKAAELVIEKAILGVHRGKAVIPMRVKEYINGKVDGERVELVEVGNGAKELKDYADAIDKAAQTLGVVARPGGVTVKTGDETNNNLIQVYIPDNKRDA